MLAPKCTMWSKKVRLAHILAVIFETVSRHFRRRTLRTQDISALVPKSS